MMRHALVLYPRTPAAAPEQQVLIEALAAIGLLGSSLELRGEARYLVGDRFFELVGFLGCSPSMRIVPPASDKEDAAADEDFCHIQVMGPYAQPRFLGGDNVRTPACPRCEAQVLDWQTMLQAWREDTAHQGTCRACAMAVTPAVLNWRRRAGVARSAVYIWNVHEAEAVPADVLLAALQVASGFAWHYFYLSQKEYT